MRTIKYLIVWSMATVFLSCSGNRREPESFALEKSGKQLSFRLDDLTKNGRVYHP
jgi:hypothetical protein